MKGTIREFSIQESRGKIEASNGNFYEFYSVDWMSKEFPEEGRSVSFDHRGECAHNVHIETDDNKEKGDYIDNAIEEKIEKAFLDPFSSNLKSHQSINEQDFEKICKIFHLEKKEKLWGFWVDPYSEFPFKLVITNKRLIFLDEKLNSLTASTITWEDFDAQKEFIHVKKAPPEIHFPNGAILKCFKSRSFVATLKSLSSIGPENLKRSKYGKQASIFEENPYSYNDIPDYYLFHRQITKSTATEKDLQYIEYRYGISSDDFIGYYPASEAKKDCSSYNRYATVIHKSGVTFHMPGNKFPITRDIFAAVEEKKYTWQQLSLVIPRSINKTFLDYKIKLSDGFVVETNDASSFCHFLNKFIDRTDPCAADTTSGKGGLEEPSTSYTQNKSAPTSIEMDAFNYRPSKTLVLFSIIVLIFGLITISNSIILGDANKSLICRAVIGKVMLRSPSIIRVDKVGQNIIHLSYNLPHDHETYRFRCRVTTLLHSVVWATASGRWRNSEHDPDITFSVNKRTIVITEEYTNGEESSQAYRFE